MRKLLLTVSMLIFATSCFAMSNRPQVLNVSPDVLLTSTATGTQYNGKVGIFNGSVAALNIAYLHSVGVYIKSDKVEIQFVSGTTFADNLSYCINLPANEVGKVGRVAYKTIDSQLNTWVNPKNNSGIIFEDSGVVLNPKSIVRTYKTGGFVADKNKNGCGNPYGSYPNWQVNVVISMSLAEYKLIEPALDDWAGANLVTKKNVGSANTK